MRSRAAVAARSTAYAAQKPQAKVDGKQFVFTKIALHVNGWNVFWNSVLAYQRNLRLYAEVHHQAPCGVWHGGVLVGVVYLRYS